MDYCGLDLGRKSSRYCIVDKERNILRQGNVSTHEAGLRKLFNKQAPLEIVVEASCGAFWIAEMLMEMGHTVYVVDPNRTKAIGASLIKNDKLDARWLAYLCAAGLLAKVRVQTRSERIARMPSTSRDAVVRARTKLLNAVRGMAAAEGVSLRQSRPEQLVSLVDAVQEHLPDGMYDAMLPLLDAIEGLNVCVDSASSELVEKARTDAVLLRLQTVPGVGPLTAGVYAAAITDPSRFKSGRDVGAYLGLVPSLYQSGKTMRRGRITKRGNRQARWALTMAANSLLLCKKSTPLVEWGKSLHKRVGRKKAIVAIARKLASVLWAIWLREQEYDPKLAT